MSRHATHSQAVMVEALRQAGGVVEHAEKMLGTGLRYWIAKCPELAALKRKRIAGDRSNHLPWTHPCSPWMAGVGVELEQHETGGIGAGWSRMSKTGRAA